MNPSKTNATSRRSDVILGAATLLVFVAVMLISNLEKALVFAVMFGVFSALAQSKWESRKNRLVWVILAVLAVIHIVVLSLVRIPELRFGLISLPFALVDGFAIYGLLNWIERRFPVVRDVDAGE